MNRLRRLAEQGRNIPLAVAIVAAVVLLVAGLLIIAQSERSYRADQAREAHVQADILAASVTAAIDFGDRAAAQEAVDALRVNPKVQAAGIYDAAGALFVGYSRGAQPLPSSTSAIEGKGSNEVQATLPVMRGETRVGSVYLTNAIEPVARRLARYAMVALLLFMTMLVLGVLAIAHAALSRANRELAGQARSLAETNSELQLQMEERSRAEENLRQAQKMQALGQLTGGIAHDFNNMLTVIQGSADILRRPKLTEEKRVRFAGAIVETAERAASLTRQLLAFARRQPLSPVPLDLNSRVRAMVPLLAPLLGETVRIQLDLGEGLHAVQADPGQLETAILNIVVNARDAMPEGGTVTIRTRKVDGNEAGALGSAIELSIADTGGGIDPALRDRVFEPFFTTKSVGKGTGLGLSQVYGFVAQTGGEVRIEGEPGSGARLVLLLPPTEVEPVANKSLNEPTPQRATGRVLLVEDNPQVGAFAETLLGELGHEVLRATNGLEALELTDTGAAYDVVFSDVVMPGMNGLELAGELKLRRPGVPIILTTGYSDRIATAGAQGHPIISKPYRLETIADAIEQALSSRRAA
jgi:signal transduction histidine kinase/ActR/RegA family two-component response regulator